MKDITKITYLLLGLMLSVPLAAQKTYYMDPEGSDSNPGTSDKPFATLVKVQEVVVAGDVVYINPGTFISAVLIGIPGSSSAIATCFDGFPMTKKGQAGKALGIGMTASFIGTVVSVIIATVFSVYFLSGIVDCNNRNAGGMLLFCKKALL